MTLEQATVTLDNMLLTATSAGAQFDCPLANLPPVSIEKILRYGFQRWVNDYANAKGNGESDQTKRDLASKRISDLLTGITVSKSRMPTAGDETNIQRKVTLEALSAKDRKALSEMPDKGVAKLAEIWEANEAKLKPLFDAEVLRREEKAKAPKIKLSVIAI